MRGETKLQRQLIFLCAGHESPFKVKIKLKQAVAVAASSGIWHTVTELGSETKEGTLPEGVETRESRLFTKLFRILVTGWY